MLARSAILFLVGLLNLLVAFSVLLRDKRKLSNIAFFGLSFFAGAWAIGIGGFLLAHSISSSILWAKIFYLSPLVLVVSLVFFGYYFPNYQKLPKYVFLIATVPFSLLVGAIFFVHPFVITGIAYHDWGKEVLLDNLTYFFYSLYLIVCFVWGLTVICFKSFSESGLYKAQAKLFFVGYLPAVSLGLLFNLILPARGNYRLIWIGPLATNIYIVATAYSIVRHKMFDIRLVIARSLAYLASVVILASIYGFLVFGTAQLIFKLHFSIAVQIGLSAATAVAGLSFQRIRTFFDKQTNRYFYKDAYDPQDLIDELNKVLVTNIELTTLVKRSAEVMARNLKASYCAFGLKTDDGSPRIISDVKLTITPEEILYLRHTTPHFHQTVIAADYLDPEYDELRRVMRKNNFAVLVRLAPHLSANEEGLGYIILGTKKSGDIYTTQDLRVLDIIAKEMVIAIQNAQHFEEIQHFNETLQENVKQATRELSKTNDKLKALDQTKDEFISMASHQLRTPLTAVKGYLSMVLEGDAGILNANQRKLLEQSYFSSQRMVYLIADLLNLSRLNTGKFIMQTERVNLCDVVQAEVDQLCETAKSRAVSLHFVKPASFPELELDETKIHQVVMNFIDNAIYYTPEGGEIEVELRETPEAVEYLVRDNGIGVPKAEQHHLFTKFYRADNAKRARPDGTGLGLFMAKKVIVAQGGSIIFESKEGKGSTFGFRFNKIQI